MKAVALYVLTSLVTGLYNYYLLYDIVNGAPINLLNCIVLLGSTTLLVAAILVQLRPNTAAKIGLAGSLLLWVLYAPLIFVGLLMPFSTRIEIWEDISFHEYVPLVGRLVGPILLIACTVISTLFIRRLRESGTAK